MRKRDSVANEERGAGFGPPNPINSKGTPPLLTVIICNKTSRKSGKIDPHVSLMDINQTDTSRSIETAYVSQGEPLRWSLRR